MMNEKRSRKFVNDCSYTKIQRHITWRGKGESKKQELNEVAKLKGVNAEWYQMNLPRWSGPLVASDTSQHYGKKVQRMFVWDPTYLALSRSTKVRRNN